MPLTVALLALGLILLFSGGELLVRGASRLASRLGLSTLFIGLTVVACATSLPELVVSMLATLEGQPEIATGNVIGSNIANIGLVLGISALAAPIYLQFSTIWRDLAVSVVATLAFALAALGGWLGRPEAAAMFAGLLVYLAWSYRGARARSDGVEASLITAGKVALGRAELLAVGRSMLQVAAGLALLVGGAHLAVVSAVEIAALAGLSRTVVGLTIVAVGTSLPELATSLVAAVKREPAIAVGNVLGSNIFNLLGILGLVGLVEPLSVSTNILRYDVPVALAFTFLCISLMWTGCRLSRSEGLLLLVTYGVYCSWLVLARGAVT